MFVKSNNTLGFSPSTYLSLASKTWVMGCPELRHQTAGCAPQTLPERVCPPPPGPECLGQGFHVGELACDITEAFQGFCWSEALFLHLDPSLTLTPHIALTFGCNVVFVSWHNQRQPQKYSNAMVRSYQQKHIY